MSNPITTASNPRVGEDVGHLKDLLERFRDFVIERAKQWDTSKGPCNHHNPIWAEIAEALASAPSPEAGAGGDLVETVAATLWLDAFGHEALIGWDLAAKQAEERGPDSAAADQVSRFRKRAQRIADAVIRSGKLVASTGSGEETKGATPMGSGHSRAEPSGLGASPECPSRGWQPISTAPTEGEFLVGLHVRHQVAREVFDEWEEIHVIAIDDETGEIADGYENGWQLSDYEFWKPLDPLPSVRDRSSEAAETSGSAERQEPGHEVATPEATSKSSPSQTPVDPQMTVEEARRLLEYETTRYNGTPVNAAAYLRWRADLVRDDPETRDVQLRRAAAIEAALRTLQAAGEVR